MAGDFFRFCGRRLVPLLLVLAAVAGPARAETLLVLGDSISAAWGIDEREGWVALLRERLRDEGREVAVVNASVSGETTSGGLARLPALLREHRPRWLIVELGGNDGLRGYPPGSMEQNLRAMVREGKEAGARVLILGMQMPPNYGRAYSDAFAAVFPRVAREEEVPLLPFFLETVALAEGGMQEDGIHPSAQAQPALLEHAWPCVQALLGEPGACSP